LLIKQAQSEKLAKEIDSLKKGKELSTKILEKMIPFFLFSLKLRSFLSFFSSESLGIL